MSTNMAYRYEQTYMKYSYVHISLSYTSYQIPYEISMKSYQIPPISCVNHFIYEFPLLFCRFFAKCRLECRVDFHDLDKCHF